jgi:serine protease Do
MPADQQIWTLADGFVNNTITVAEREAIQEKLATEPAFAAAFNECADMIRSLKANGRQQKLRAMLKDIHKQEATPPRPKRNITIPLRTHYLRTASVAAGIALLTSLVTYWSVHPSDKKALSQYSVLRREIETIKRSQNQLIQNINQSNTPKPPAVARYSGTGFALTNDGYFTTSYHVTDGADSVYILSHDGEYYRAYVVAFEPKTDIAILKVEADGFKFSKGDVPYTFSAGKAGLGSKVYTLGYPEDEIVYNEGYISAKNGYEADSMQYRLELPADPGQSGAPVLDANGNVLAIVTARGSQAEGNTYAVGAKALIQLVQSMPKEMNVRLPKVNRLGKMNREQQIKKLEYYTCSVKVYKK